MTEEERSGGQEKHRGYSFGDRRAGSALRSPPPRLRLSQLSKLFAGQQTRIRDGMGDKNGGRRRYSRAALKASVFLCVKINT